MPRNNKLQESFLVYYTPASVVDGTGEIDASLRVISRDTESNFSAVQRDELVKEVRSFVVLEIAFTWVLEETLLFYTINKEIERNVCSPQQGNQ